MPAWVNEYEYAKEYGCHPQDVPKVVTVQAWHRWLLMHKAESTREIYEAFKRGESSSFTPEQRELFDWPAMDGEY